MTFKKDPKILNCFFFFLTPLGQYFFLFKLSDEILFILANDTSPVVWLSGTFEWQEIQAIHGLKVRNPNSNQQNGEVQK